MAPARYFAEPMPSTTSSPAFSPPGRTGDTACRPPLETPSRTLTALVRPPPTDSVTNGWPEPAVLTAATGTIRLCTRDAVTVTWTFWPITRAGSRPAGLDGPGRLGARPVR